MQGTPDRLASSSSQAVASSVSRSIKPGLKTGGHAVIPHDCVEAQSVRLSLATCSTARGCFRLRHVLVDRLEKDGTLGLLLHGTSIIGFRSSQAEGAGWHIGDQIVEVNQQAVGNFIEFQEAFREATTNRGFLADFSVLRREEQCKPDEGIGAEEGAEDAILSFFNTTDLMHLEDQLDKRFGKPGFEEDRTLSANGCGEVSARDKLLSSACDLPATSARNKPAINLSLENPFILALEGRRKALTNGSAGWARYADDGHVEASDSIASRLAQRQDGVSTLYLNGDALDSNGHNEACIVSLDHLHAAWQASMNPQASNEVCSAFPCCSDASASHNTRLVEIEKFVPHCKPAHIPPDLGSARIAAAPFVVTGRLAEDNRQLLVPMRELTSALSRTRPELGIALTGRDAVLAQLGVRPARADAEISQEARGWMTLAQQEVRPARKNAMVELDDDEMLTKLLMEDPEFYANFLKE